MARAKAGERVREGDRIDRFEEDFLGP